MTCKRQDSLSWSLETWPLDIHSQRISKTDRGDYDVRLSRYELLLFFGLISFCFFHAVLVVALVDSELILGIQTMISM